MKYEGQSPAAFKLALQKRAQTEGALIAYEAAVAICKDPQAPAQAKSAALNAILRMGGYFEDPGAGELEKEPHEMSQAELTAAIRRHEARMTDMASQIDEDDDPGVMG